MNKRNLSCLRFGIVILFLFSSAGGSNKSAQAQEFNLLAERDFRVARTRWMRSEKSPLALAGLYWLKAGENSFGTDRGNSIVLPAGTAPAQVGSFLRTGKKIFLQVESSAVKVTLKGNPVKNREVLVEKAGTSADLLELGDLRMKIIQRGDRLGLRLINLKNPLLISFQRLDFFEPSPPYWIEAEFRPYTPPKKIKIMSVIGVEEEMACPGVVRFQLGGQEFSLEPIGEPGEPLFFIFKDRTNGHETYGGGRFLNASPPKNGRVILDFNQATNPYCAYSAFATCPLPPSQNCLGVRIPAGEKKFPSGNHPGD